MRGTLVFPANAFAAGATASDSPHASTNGNSTPNKSRAPNSAAATPAATQITTAARVSHFRSIFPSAQSDSSDSLLYYSIRPGCKLFLNLSESLDTARVFC